jgi:hypothetical protein
LAQAPRSYEEVAANKARCLAAASHDLTAVSRPGLVSNPSRNSRGSRPPSRVMAPQFQERSSVADGDGNRVPVNAPTAGSWPAPPPDGRPLNTDPHCSGAPLDNGAGNAGRGWMGLDWAGRPAASQGSRGLQAAGVPCDSAARCRRRRVRHRSCGRQGGATWRRRIVAPLLKQRQCAWHGQSSSPEQPELQCAPPQTIAGLCSSSPQKTGTRQSDGRHRVVLLQAAGSIQAWRRWRVVGVPVTSKK